MDFAENFTHLNQNAILADHWNKVQTSIHPAVVTYKKGGQNHKKNFAFISEVVEHNSKFVRAVQMQLIQEVKTLTPGLSKMYYATDGAASQYKNKTKIYYLSTHYKKFGVHGVWLFHATSHGKGPCDGIGGTTKRMLRLQSLKGHCIKNTKDAHEFLLEKFNTGSTQIYPILLTPGDIKKTKVPQVSHAIPGTQEFHFVEAIGEEKLRLKETAENEKETIFE